MRVLVTGAAGFLGHHFVEHVLRTQPDWEVVGLASFAHRGCPLRLKHLVDNPRFELVPKVDLAAPITYRIANVIGPIDAIVNYAAESHVDRSIEDPRPFVSNNVELTMTILEYARMVKPKCVIQVSTDEVYGPAKFGQRHAEWSPILPSNPYCLPPTSRIVTTRGLRPISEFDPWTENAVSRNHGRICGEQSVAAKYTKQFKGELLRIETEHGSLEVTPEHTLFKRGTGYSGAPVQVFGGTWLPGRPHHQIDEIQAMDVAVGQHLMLARRIPAPCDAREVPLALARFLGYFVGDGSYSKRSRYVRLADQNVERLDRYRQWLKVELGPSLKSVTGAFGTIYKHGSKDCHYLQFASESLRCRIDLERPKSELAWTLADTTDEVVGAYIAGFFDAEAHYQYKDGRLVNVTVFQADKTILEAAQFYLRRLGIVAKIMPHRRGYRLSIHENLSRRRALGICTDKAIPDAGLSKAQQRGWAKSSDHMWTRVSKVTKVFYEGPVYDLEMSGLHPNFIADYFVVHNSASKAAQEAIAISWWRTYGVPVVIVNSMNLIGERQDGEKFLPLLIRHISQNEVVPIHGQAVGIGTDHIFGSRMYLHARNLADALIWLLKRPVNKYPDTDRPDRWNVVGEREISNLELAQMVAAILEKRLRYKVIDFHDARPGHDRRYALDGTAIREAGWEQPIDFMESLERTVRWTIRNPEWVK
jgi:dTDP-D-glucose 4,6-dehydratase